MKKIFERTVIYSLVLFSGIVLGVVIRNNDKTWAVFAKSSVTAELESDDSTKAEWSTDFELIEIKSKLDSNNQKAYFYKTKSEKPEPLIVSLHTWSWDYNQIDTLGDLCISNDLNYIHPDFRGVNNKIEACLSELALNDIDEAIAYAIGNSNVDTTRIYVIGVSGGGMATLGVLRKSKHDIARFSAWASISDLVAWYDESRIRENRYAGDILACTGSGPDVLNEIAARQRSPVYMTTPLKRISSSDINIYAGIYDGLQGSVPITHSINFYNTLLSELSVKDSSFYVSDDEKLQLLEYRRPLGDFGSISDRAICLVKKFRNIKLVIFEGNHEMLTEYAFNELTGN